MIFRYSSYVIGWWHVDGGAGLVGKICARFHCISQLGGEESYSPEPVARRANLLLSWLQTPLRQVLGVEEEEFKGDVTDACVLDRGNGEYQVGCGWSALLWLCVVHRAVQQCRQRG